MDNCAWWQHRCNRRNRSARVSGRHTSFFVRSSAGKRKLEKEKNRPRAGVPFLRFCASCDRQQRTVRRVRPNTEYEFFLSSTGELTVHCVLLSSINTIAHIILSQVRQLIEEIMLRYFTSFFTEFSTIMAIQPRNLTAFTNGIYSCARPFDEILYSLDSSAPTNEVSCPGVQPSSDSLKWTDAKQWFVRFFVKHDVALEMISNASMRSTDSIWKGREDAGFWSNTSISFMNNLAIQRNARTITNRRFSLSRRSQCHMFCFAFSYTTNKPIM